MQQEGVVSVLLPQTAAHLRAPMLPYEEARLGESTVLLAVMGRVGGGWGGGGELWVREITVALCRPLPWIVSQYVALLHYSEGSMGVG